MSPRVLVTGLSGFTGAYIADALVARGLEVVDPLAAVTGFDLTLPATLAAAIDQVAPDYVIHLGAISFVNHANPVDFYRVNTVGTISLLEAIARSPKPVRKIIVASSANIYGNAQGSPLGETTVPQPVNHYACSKLAMEYLVRQWFDRLPIVVVRPFNYTGRGQAAKFLIPKIVDHFRRSAEIIELGNLDVARDFSDVRDVALAYAELLDAPAISDIVNICSGKSYSLQWIIDRCTEISGHTLKVETNPAFTRADEVKTLTGSPIKLDALVGNAVRHDFSTTLRWMLEA